MKTQIIQLESHDDAISVKDKMGWGQTPRILLVWPRRGKILKRRLDLVYLLRHSSSLGAQLAFVTRDSNARYHAKKLGIPVYPNIRKAEESHWRTTSRRRRKNHRLIERLIIEKQKTHDHQKKADLEAMRQIAYPKAADWLLKPFTRLLLFTFGVLGVLAIAGILVPRAEIYITPETRWERISIPVSASADIDSVNLSGTIPARTMGVIVEGRGNIPATGRILIPDEKARGEIVFTNLTNREISIPSGTIVSTVGENPIRFATTDVVMLPAEAISENLPIQAILPGKSGNIRSNTIAAIEGPLGLEVTVGNPSPTHGGSDQISPAPSEKDYQVLVDEILAALYQTALDELTTKLDPHDVLLKTDPTEYKILEEIYTPQVGQPADHLSLLLRIEYQAYVSKGEELHSLAESILSANLSENFTPIPSTLEIEKSSVIREETPGVFSWNIQAKWQVEAQINKEEALTLVLWRAIDDAAVQLRNNLPIEKDVSIKVSPSWWPRLPILPFRMRVLGIG